MNGLVKGFDTYAEREVLERVKNYIKLRDYSALNIEPHGDYVLTDNPRISLAVFFGTVCDKNNKVLQVWLIFGGLIMMYNHESYPQLQGAISHHIGMLVASNYFCLQPTDKLKSEMGFK